MAYICPVCGFDGLDAAPYGAGEYEICPCCGFQFGVTDDNQGISFHEWREAWIEQGLPWTSKGRPAPLGWNAMEQLRRLQGSEIQNLVNEDLINTIEEK